MKLEKSWLLCLPFVSSLFRHFSLRNPSGSCVIFDNFPSTPFFPTDIVWALDCGTRKKLRVKVVKGDEGEDEKGESQN